MRSPLPGCVVDDYILVERESLLRSEQKSDADETRNKLFPRTEGPFRVVAVYSNRMTFVRRGLKDRVSIDWIVKAPYTGSGKVSNSAKKHFISNNDLRVDDTSISKGSDVGERTALSVDDLNLDVEEELSVVGETVPDVASENRTEVADALRSGISLLV